MNEHFLAFFNSKLISQNPYFTPQATYTKTSFPVTPNNSESSTYSELFLSFIHYILHYIFYVNFYNQNDNVCSSTISMSYGIPRKIREKVLH